MAQHNTTGRPKKTNWATLRTAAITAGGLAAATLTFALAASGVTESRNPVLALRFNPSDSGALAARAEQLLTVQPDDPPAQVRTLAEASLRQQNLNPRALRILGYFVTLHADTTRGRALIMLSERQSRRDTGTQLWLIEDAVQRGDVRQALAHYDIVLRTHPAIYTTLFPVLTQAISNADIRTALAPYIHRDQTWAPLFLAHAAANSTDLPALVDLVLQSGGLKDTAAARAQTRDLLQRLIANKMFATARRLAVGTSGEAAARLTTASFLPSDGVAPADPMAWQVRAEADAGGQFIGRSSKAPVLSVFANPATVSPVASKLLYLTPGNYKLTAQVTQFQGDEGAELRWRLRCPLLAANTGEDRSVWSFTSGRGSVNADIVIPEGCAVQYLDLIGVGGTGSDSMTATVSAISLRRQ